MRKYSLLTVALALVACGADTTDPLHHKDAAVGSPPPDARSTTPDASPSPPDAGTTTGATPGSVTCYSEGNPGATCALPVHCCFSNYSSFHDGVCTTQSCVYGTIMCDGPEDCPSGELCCAHAVSDPVYGTKYRLACQSGGCGSAPLNQEICHPATGCSTGAACVTAYGNDNDLPRTLYICR
jgi:hypothetical protein